MPGPTINQKSTDFPGGIGNSPVGSVHEVQLQITRGTNAFIPLASFKRMCGLALGMFSVGLRRLPGGSDIIVGT